MKLKLKNMKYDIMSGFSTAAIALPQNMAYALILDINPVYGIYASIISMLTATIFGGSSFLIVGPTNMMAVALASGLDTFKGSNYLEVIFLTTFMIGLFQYLFVVFKLSDLVQYISHPVIVGLSTGVSILIITSQLKNLTGVEITGANILAKLWYFFINLGEVNYLNLSVGFLTILFIYSLNKINPKLPNFLLSIVLVTILTTLTGLTDKILMVGKLPESFIDFNLISFKWSVIRQVYPQAFSFAILGLIQTMTVLQSVALKTKENISYEQEFKAQGLANLTTSFFSGFAISGSFSNTFANYQAGARSKLSQLFCAFAIIIFSIFLRPAIQYIPIAGLAGLVITAAIGIIDIKDIIPNLKTTKGDALIFWTTFLATIILPNLDQAVYLGVLISLFVVIKISKEPQVELLHYQRKNDDYYLHEIKPGQADLTSCKVIDISGDIHFSAAQNLTDKLNDLYTPNSSYIIRIRKVKRIDITILKVFSEFTDTVINSGGSIKFTGLNNRIYQMFINYGLAEKIGDDNLYQPEKGFFEATKKAIKNID